MQKNDQNEKTKKYMQQFNLKDSIGKLLVSSIFLESDNSQHTK